MRSLVSLGVVVALLVGACSNTPDLQSPANPVTVATTGPVTTSAPTTDAPQDSEAPTTNTDPNATSTLSDPTVPIEELALDLEVVATGFAQPVFLTSPPGDTRLFVVDQPGVIWVIDDGDPEIFLDIRGRVRFEGEQGLLGLAFDPRFPTTGLFYVNYTDAGGTTQVSEFSVGDDATAADVESERVVLSVEQPAANHNGGMIDFGPDGMLWIGMGDGGRADDAFGNGQDSATLLGSMLRIDPDTSQLDRPDCCGYAVPEDNPYVDGGAVGDFDGAVENWAIGLRNPWRWSFDGSELWIGDVGQGRVEEVSVVDTAPGAPRNFGWPTMEGTECFQSDTCDSAGLILPIHEYRHDEGCSITGGYVYRGTAIPSLDGHYFFSDFCGGWIRSIRVEAGTVVDEREWFGAGTVPSATSFGLDAAGELYVLAAGGDVLRIVAAS